MNIVERIRISGRCPPSLMRIDSDTDFGSRALKVLDANALHLSVEATVPDDFQKLLELTTSDTNSLSGDYNSRNAVLVSRRAIVLTLVGSTPMETTVLHTILQNGYLSVVKIWMDDILKGSIGGIDLLLHLLTKITLLPVTKSIVKESGLGKAVGSIAKHRFCADSPNKGAIVQRVNAIKDAWHKSVKIRKDRSQSSAQTSDKTSSSSKRVVENTSQHSSPTAKKIKLDDTKKSSFSSLLKKVDPASILNTSNKSSSLVNGDASKKVAVSKKPVKRLKWKDHFGGKLEASKCIDDDTLHDVNEDESGSWSDRKSRDRLREKELIAKAKKAKLLDDDDEGLGQKANSLVIVQPTIEWHIPPLLPERKENQNNSKEKAAQMTRMASVVQAAYLSELNVPMNPAPLSDVERALDMTSQSSTVSQSMPFFVPQVPAAPVEKQQPLSASTSSYPSSPAQPVSSIASVETVQALGLPSFLAGQNLQALQTLASTPKLLGSFVDSNGMYDQVRLMNLVQTLSQNSPTSDKQNQGSNTGFQQSTLGQNVDASGTYGQTSGNGGIYGMSTSVNEYGGQGVYGSNAWQGNGAKTGGYRGAQNSSEGNLHLSGYGPGTTQSEIIALFSPYVQVSEIVMKATFSFVNTNDPIGAKQAREALNGALLGGTPVRINMAQRKNRDANQNISGYGKEVANVGSHYGRNTGGFSGMNNTGYGQSQVPPPPMGLPSGQSNGDTSIVRDDRGNPATKNLFVAGYGQGTTENHLREVFSAHTQIIGIISKGTFSFINTNDKSAAIHAREALSGTMLNGGVLRINFAKETGRLGTSFDLTYGGGQSRPHYGRSY